MPTEQLEFKVNDEWGQFARENSWASFIPEFAEDAGGNKFMRARGRSVSYRIVSKDKQGNQTYECAQCSGEIKGARVVHPIWDGPFPCSGSGKCHYETVPYCPKCEEQPSGAPISIGSKIR